MFLFLQCRRGRKIFFKNWWRYWVTKSVIFTERDRNFHRKLYPFSVTCYQQSSWHLFRYFYSRFRAHPFPAPIFTFGAENMFECFLGFLFCFFGEITRRIKFMCTLQEVKQITRGILIRYGSRLRTHPVRAVFRVFGGPSWRNSS